jgi:hypothetical protein
MKTAAALGALAGRQYAEAAQVIECNTLLRRVVAVLMKMTEVTASAVHEELAEYATELEPER